MPFATGAATATDPTAILIVALAIDAVLGDPAWLYRAVPHPVVLIGRVVDWGEQRLNRPQRSARDRFWRGLVFTAAVTALAAAIGWGAASLLTDFDGAWLVEAALASTLLAFRSLFDHVRAVALALTRDLEEGRRAVAHIVGRDTASLDEAGIARASVESIAENFSDGVVAPGFWYLIFGLPGLCAYKAINTLDSMIGHRDRRFEAFGKAAARLDDAANYIPARLTGLLFVLAAVFLPRARAGRAWRVMLRDASKHRSVNAGWPEAAVAGALGFALAGPRRYGGQVVADAWIGEGRAALAPTDILAALRLYLVAGMVLIVFLVVL